MARMDALSDALLLLREARGLTQRQVGAALGVDGSVVGGWERGKRTPSVSRLGQLADVLDLDLGELDDALELAGGRPVLGRRRFLSWEDLDPVRLARLLLGPDRQRLGGQAEAELR